MEPNYTFIIRAESLFLLRAFSSKCASLRVDTLPMTCSPWLGETRRELLAMQVAVSSLSPVNIQI